MTEDKRTLPEVDTHIVRRYTVDGYDAGKLAPVEVGSTVLLSVDTTSLAGMDRASKLVMDSETAVEFAKAILSTAASQGERLES